MDEEAVVVQATKLHNYRIKHIGESTFPRAYSEAAFYDLYGIKMAKEEQKVYHRRGIMCPADSSGQRIGLIFSNSPDEMFVNEDYIDALGIDVCVMCYEYPGDCDFIGWLPRSEVSECELSYTTDNNGNRVSVDFKIPSKYLMNMPAALDFVIECNCEFNRIWNDEFSAWECFNCGRCKPSGSERETIARLNTRFLAEKAEEQQESKR